MVPRSFALYDRAIWDKYQLTRLAGDEFRTNTLIIERNVKLPIPPI